MVGKFRKLIVNKKDRTVIYDSKEKEYEKYINPDISQRLEILFGLKRSPGNNVMLLTKIFKKNNIKTYEVVSHTKYSYVTKEIEGMTLLDAVIKNKDNKKLLNNYMSQYFQIIKKIVKLGIYYGDFYFNNFMVNKKGELYIIDIDEMEFTLYSRLFKNKKMIPRLKKSLDIQLERLEKIGVTIPMNCSQLKAF